MSFLFPTIVAIGLPLAAVPILIHLLNLRRQRKIEWAAMQFLMESQRRNRTWVFFRQLLLLLSRIAAIAVVACLLGGMVLQDSWTRFFGTGVTHHVLLVDDSFSMSDEQGETNALTRAKQVVRQVVGQAAQQPHGTRISLLTFTEAARLTAGEEPKLYHQLLDEGVQTQLESRLTKLACSDSNVGPEAGLRGIGRLPKSPGEETLVLHVLSDFRARHFTESSQLKKTLIELGESFSYIHLVQCVRKTSPNVAITSLTAESGLRAAGVESWMTVAVANRSDQTVNDVSVRITQDEIALPLIVLPEIPPNSEVSHRFRIRLNGVGAHQLIATLDADAVEADNHRYFACHMRAAVPVLLIDGSRGAKDAFFLAKALNPGGATRTGWQPRTESVAFLRDTFLHDEFLRDKEHLDQFAAICLLDVPRLSENAITKLTEYVDAGGGLAFFMGTNVDRQFYNERLYREGEGLFPVPLNLPTQLTGGRSAGLPDMKVSDHRLFQALAGERNSFLPRMMIDFFYAIQSDWLPRENAHVAILAETRDGAPLVVGQRLGNGRIVAHLTKLSAEDTSLGTWSNWCLNPVFPVLANELFGYLSAGQNQTDSLTVGEPLQIAVTSDDYSSPFRIVLPGNTPQEYLPQEQLIEATLADGMLLGEIEQLPKSGIVLAELEKKNGELERLAFAVNVDTAESNLTLLTRQQFDEHLSGAPYEFSYADAIDGGEQRIAGFSMSHSFLALLVGLLLFEQWLAYSASYHTTFLPSSRFSSPGGQR